MNLSIICYVVYVDLCKDVYVPLVLLLIKLFSFLCHCKLLSLFSLFIPLDHFY